MFGKGLDSVLSRLILFIVMVGKSFRKLKFVVLVCMILEVVDMFGSSGRVLVL